MMDKDPTTPQAPSTPLNIAGLLAGTTIHIEGDTGNFHFSGQFSLNQLQPKAFDFCLPETSWANPLPSSLPTPAADQIVSELQNDQAISPSIDLDENQQPDFVYNSKDHHITPVEKKNHVVTRLQSGVLSPVAYFSSRRKSKSSSGLSIGSRSRRQRRRRRESTDPYERMLRRRSLPVQPCNSYSFFVMAKWRTVAAKSATFQETGKRIRKMWHKLSDSDKQVFVEMALKDKSRYKKQCALLKAENSPLHLMD